MILMIALFLLTSARIGSAQIPARDVWRSDVAGFSVAVVERPGTEANRTDPDYVVRVTGNARPAQELTLLYGGGRNLNVHVWNNQRLILVGDRVVSIVDIPSATLVDEFLGVSPSISPDRRFVAYSRRTSRLDDEDDVYLVYDVSRSAPDHRLEAAQDAIQNLQNAGIPVFPEINRATRSYAAPASNSEEPHSRRSPITWLNSQTFAFLDFQGTISPETGAGALRVVVVGPRSGPGSCDPAHAQRRGCDADRYEHL